MPTLTRRQARQDPTHDRRLESSATASRRADAALHPYEWLCSPSNGLREFNKVWRKMFKHKKFPTCNSHLTQRQLGSLKRKLHFSRLGNKPLFSPFAASGAHYSQVVVEEGTKLRASAHVFAVVYKVRFLEQGDRRMEVEPFIEAAA